MKKKKVVKKKLTAVQRAKMRVRVAKDVLAQLDLRKITAHSGTYLTAHLPSEVKRSIGPTAQLQRVIAKKQFTCEVCAIGSLFVADVIRRDACTVADAGMTVEVYAGKTEFYEFGEDGPMRARLGEFFSHDQLERIEMAFEGYGIGEASDFYEQYESDESRMRAIMENIIENRGTFKLTAPRGPQ